MEEFGLKVIARLRSDFSSKFGVPRQSGLVEQLRARIVFEPQYRNADALRGLENFSHIWLLWGFSLAEQEDWSPTVRPPKLGGNRRMGVFATRSPYRPNSIGLSSVKLESIDKTENEGTVLTVCGADLADGTPIYDIKPYLAYTDAHPEAESGFSVSQAQAIKVRFPAPLLDMIPADRRQALLGVLAADPRPAYIADPERVFGFGFAGFEIKFTADDDTLTVTEVKRQ